MPPDTFGHRIERALRARQWNPILTFWGLFAGLVCLWLAVGYALMERHPFGGSFFLLLACLLLIGGMWHAWKASHPIKWACTAITFAAFLVGDYYWIKSLKQPIPWPLLYLEYHPVWMLVLVLVFLLAGALQSARTRRLIVEDGAREKANLNNQLCAQTKELEQRQAEREELRRKLDAARESKKYLEVQIEQARKDAAAKSIDIEHVNKQLQQKEEQFQKSKEYAAGLGRNVTTLREQLKDCNLQLAKFIDAVPSVDDPCIMLEFSLERLPFPAWQKFTQERPILLRNIGRSEALDVRVQDITLSDMTAKFRTIGILLPNSEVSIRPDIAGVGDMAGIHEFEVLLQNAWFTFFWDGDSASSGQTLITEITIKYQDRSRIFEFSTSATLTYNQSTGLTQASNFVHQRTTRNQDKGKEKERSITKTESLGQDRKSKVRAIAMPENRPKVVPAGFAEMSPGHSNVGLFIENEGDASAYDVLIPEFPLMKAKIQISRNFPRLTKQEGKQFCTVCVERQKNDIVMGGGMLFEEMRKRDIDTVQFSIQYRDGENRWYVTKCRFERNVTARGGIVARYITQEFMTAAKASGDPAAS